VIGMICSDFFWFDRFSSAEIPVCAAPLSPISPQRHGETVKRAHLSRSSCARHARL
jgi:hypothetical protein